MRLDDPSSWIDLRSTRLRALVDPQGAQLVVLRDAQGRDLLWNGDAAWWTGRAPVLFPIVGELANGRYRWLGRDYTLPRHGFARGLPFSVERRAERSATLLLRSSDSTRAVYPFDFELRVSFEVSDAGLRVQAAVRNTGAGVLPASIGFHPAFRWPLGGGPREGHWILFEHDEPEPARRLDGAGLLRARTVPTPVRGRRLDLDDSLFIDDVLILDRLRSRRLTYGNAHARLTVEYPDATHLGLWTKPGAGFLCIEPWRGVADPEGASGDFSAKPGLMHVPAGEEAHLTMTLSPD